MSATDGVAERHLFGRENELGTDGSSALQHVINYYKFYEKLPTGVRRSGNFLENGARLYVDYNSTPEYAGPECQTIREAVASDVVGQKLLTELVAEINDDPVLSTISPDALKANSRVVDDYGITNGCHENYGVDPRIDPSSRTFQGVLAAHLATRQIFTGAGEIRDLNPETLSYQGFVSQKVRRMETMTNEETRRNKPLVNLRDEPLGRRRRVHVTSADATSTPWATTMAYGTTSLVLRLLEHNVDGLKDVELRSPVKAAAEIGNDLELTQTVELVSGNRKAAALDIQEQFVVLANKLAGEVELPAEELVVLAEWQRAIDDARVDPMQLDHRAEWVAKLSIADRARDRADLSGPAKAKRIRSIEMAWGELSDRGVTQRLTAGQWFEDPLNTLDLAAEMGYSPPVGRAALRGMAVRTLSQRQLQMASSDAWGGIYWDSVRCLDRTVRLLDDFGEDPGEIDQLERLLHDVEML